ncbi:unnamed protein product [Lactuca virosa]|uniref:ATP-dependent DNA helicase n=1 Tax=Lactuca virosa TaxID=75947 RepID=A0AAU9MXQ5_9ASTR|nr:unnamed protein product [Lactuca virosa]
MKLRIIRRRDRDGRTYNLPTASEVAALIIGDICDSVEYIDIVVETRSGFLQRISELHHSYLTLQYPLLFPYGDDGYNVDILHRGVTSTTNIKRAKYDYTMIESERLYYIRRQQHVLRCESYENLRNQKAQGTTTISNVGQRVILLSSFTGGARYMLQSYLDAMSLCKWFGYPDFFITFTCNPKWLEVKRYPSVVRLPIHLPGQQQIGYREDDDIDDVLDKPYVASSMFTAWMECNAVNGDARKLTYVEFPTKFVRKCGEAYFLRILLSKVKGPKSFEEIRTVNGEEYSSFRDACYALGLLDDDKEYIDAIKEASHYGSGFYIQFLFATLLMCNSMSKPEVVWENTWEYLADGILYNQRQRFKSPDLSFNEDQLKNLTLFEIEQVLLRNKLSLKSYKNIPISDVDSVSSSNYRLITEELDYDIPVTKTEFDRMFLALKNEQRYIFLDIMSAAKENKGGVFFVYGYGGTDKSFLWKTISAAIRKDGHIVLNVASSGIASLLLPGGRTAHSRFIIPFELTEDSVCRINRDSDLASLLRKTSLIIWYEAPMVHKHAFEALDRSLKDVFRSENSSNSDIPFGGKVIIFGGDFRQILPVIPGESRQNIVNASLSSSYLWKQCKIHKLTKNMRLTVGMDQSDIEKIRDFVKWLLDIGEGKLGGINDGETVIDIPNDILINDPHDPIGSLIDFVYPSILEKYNNTSYFQERAILAPKNEVVQEINDCLLSKFPGDENPSYSIDFEMLSILVCNKRERKWSRKSR